MTGTTVALILNPAPRHADRARQLVVRACLEAGLAPPTVLETTVAEPGGPQAAAAAAQGCRRIVVAGGDGTVREVAGALGRSDAPAQGASAGEAVGASAAHAEDTPVLGIVPGGTANLFARGIRLPIRDLRAAARIAVTGPPRALDLGRALLTDTGGSTSEHPFLVVVGLGHDAGTVAALDPVLKARLRWLAYFEPGLRRLARPGRPVSLSLDGEVASTEQLWSVLAVNTARLPLGARVVPRARPDDGLLHVVLVAPLGLTGWVRVARTGLGGRHIHHPALRYRQGRELTVRPTEPALVQVDGDVVADIVSARVRLTPAALHVAMPPPARSPSPVERDG